MLSYRILPQADMLEVEVTCIVCGTTKKIQVPESGFKAWYNRGVLIQSAMPSVPAEDREMMMSQICGKCFEEMFADD